MPEANLSVDCPLTFAKFVRAEDYTEDAYPAAHYITHQVNEGIKFVTSTTRGDNLPLTSFKVEQQPCLDNNNVSRSPNSIYYPLEKDRLQQECEIIEQFDEAFDTRYIKAGLEVSEHDTQVDSGVLATLETLPLSTMYLTESIKEDVLYDFWSRPTIAWRLECEDTVPKNRIVQAARYE